MSPDGASTASVRVCARACMHTPHLHLISMQRHARGDVGAGTHRADACGSMATLLRCVCMRSHEGGCGGAAAAHAARGVPPCVPSCARTGRPSRCTTTTTSCAAWRPRCSRARARARRSRHNHGARKRVSRAELHACWHACVACIGQPTPQTTTRRGSLCLCAMGPMGRYRHTRVWL